MLKYENEAFLIFFQLIKMTSITRTQKNMYRKTVLLKLVPIAPLEI